MNDALRRFLNGGPIGAWFPPVLTHENRMIPRLRNVLGVGGSRFRPLPPGTGNRRTATSHQNRQTEPR